MKGEITQAASRNCARKQAPSRAALRGKKSGFTLLEILMALIFIALPLAAIIQSIGGYVYDAAYLKEKTFAHWVAMNQLTELQVTRQWPSTGDKSGESLMVGESWHWAYTVVSTPEPNMRRVDIEVFAPADQTSVLTTLTAYIGKP